MRLEWWWESEYPEDRPVYESTNEAPPARAAARIVDAWSHLEDAGRARELLAAA